jgi:glutathione-dependent peroxiredoxin
LKEGGADGGFVVRKNLTDVEFEQGAGQMLFNHEDQDVPQVTFRMFIRILGEVAWYNLSTADLFEDKTVVVFTVSGAFFPYSSMQLLGYNKYAEVFRANGIDEIICISVNDPFALAKWVQEEGADQVRCIPDVNGDFTREMEMMVNLSDQGMGQRSWRYSMLVQNKVIEKMFVEQDGFEVMPMVANAETMLNYINTSSQRPKSPSRLC